jgi:hypothetical protein
MILYDKNKHIKYTLSDGREFIVSNYVDERLRDGYHQASPKRKRIWIDIMEDLIQKAFNGNISEASRVLLQLYGKVEYKREELYNILPMLQERKRKKKDKVLRRELNRFAERIIREGVDDIFLNIYRRKKCIREPSLQETLDTEEAEEEDVESMLMDFVTRYFEVHENE